MSTESTLAARRKALGLSQAQLAEEFGITQGSVSRNETAAEPERRFVLALEALEARAAANAQAAA